MRRLWLAIPVFLLAVPVLAAPKNGMQVIPEPGSITTLGAALAGLAIYLKRRK
ncbi:MAG: PEP-CTERM sorting domain-containing protein [Armatimonadota bacterium]|nr:PEP-CTERM sorting domain-containing protein [Armatimonadota bacterium]